jgi:hypothetical protein
VEGVCCNGGRRPPPWTAADLCPFLVFKWEGATPLYVRKQRELAIYDEDLVKFYVIEIKSVMEFPARSRKKTRGEKMKVSPIMLLKTHVEKMSETGHAIICMKTRNIKVARHYMFEKKRS